MHDFQQLRCNPIECVPTLFSLVLYIMWQKTPLLTIASHIMWLGCNALMYSKLELVTVYAVVAFKSVKNRFCQNIFNL